MQIKIYQCYYSPYYKLSHIVIYLRHVVFNVFIIHQFFLINEYYIYKIRHKQYLFLLRATKDLRKSYQCSPLLILFCASVHVRHDTLSRLRPWHVASVSIFPLSSTETTVFVSFSKSLVFLFAARKNEWSHRRDCLGCQDTHRWKAKNM